MIPSCNNNRPFSTALCVKQCLPLLIGKFLTTGCPHRLEYSDQGLINKAHCCVEFEHALYVPEDLGAHFVLVAGAL
jgi:hypothetical protein